MRFKTLVVVALSLCASCPASFAQQPASGPVVPPPQCEKPGSGPGLQPTGAEIDRFQKKVMAYKACVDDYVRASAVKVKELNAEASAYAAAANAAIDEFNAYATTLNAKAKSD